MSNREEDEIEESGGKSTSKLGNKAFEDSSNPDLKFR